MKFSESHTMSKYDFNKCSIEFILIIEITQNYDCFFLLNKTINMLMPYIRTYNFSINIINSCI